MKTIAQQINWDFKTNGQLRIKDKNGNQIYYEQTSGFWERSEYDSRSSQIYYENSNGFWTKSEYDSNDVRIYLEDSEDGVIKDNRPKPCEDKIVEIDGVKYKLVKQ